MEAKYKRVIIKLSGEALAGEIGYGLESNTLNTLAEQIAEISALGVEVACVVGGGNIWRGIAGAKRGIDRATADYMGMLATVINALALQDVLEKHDVDTDPTAALRAAEIEAEAILMAKKVDGVYDCDPKTHPEAQRFETLTFLEVLNRGLKVMDSTAISLCMDNNIPIQVFNITEKGNMMKAVLGEKIGTLVGTGE